MLNRMTQSDTILWYNVIFGGFFVPSLIRFCDFRSERNTSSVFTGSKNHVSSWFFPHMYTVLAFQLSFYTLSNLNLPVQCELLPYERQKSLPKQSLLNPRQFKILKMVGLRKNNFFLGKKIRKNLPRRIRLDVSFDDNNNIKNSRYFYDTHNIFT